jgi:hypothetical protein
VNPCFSSSPRQRRELFWFSPRKIHRRFENRVGCEPMT